MSGKVVVNRSMSLDGFIAGPGDAMDWVFDFIAPDEFPEIAAATGAMLIGRRTYEVANRMEADKPGSTDYPGLASSGTRVATTPDALATSTAATRWYTRSYSSSWTSCGSSTARPPPPARLASSGGLPAGVPVGKKKS